MEALKSEWLDAEEAAKYIGIGLSNLYSLAQGGKIPSNKVGKIWKFNKNDLDSWIRVNKPLEDFFTATAANIDGNPLIRDPQREAHAAALAFFNENNPTNNAAIILLPVGCGKSGLISMLPFGIARGRVLVIAPNLTIRHGLEKTLDITNQRECFWRKCKVLDQKTMLAGPFLAVLDGKDANIHDCQKSHIVLTNIQQLASSADKWLPNFPEDFFDLILVDEGHHSVASSWMKVFERFPKAKVINLTATPFRSDRQQISGELIYRYSFKRAMIKGYIKHLQASYVAPDEIYFSYKGDQKRHSLEEVLKLKEEDWFSKGVALAPECNKNIVDASLDKLEKLRQTGTNHQLIAVACSVAHAKSIRSLYAERGYEADVIYSQMPEDKKEEVIRKLKSGLLDCIVQVQMLGEGFDHPKLSVAAIFRPFRSLSPFIQFVGRVLRSIVQNSPGHPDNMGWIVTHIGLNQDKQLDDFKDLERDDQLFFEEIMKGDIESEGPEGDGVKEGRRRLKLTEDMVVAKEVVSSFIEDTFVDSDDELIIAAIRKQAEELGLDADAFAALAKRQKQSSGKREVEASAPFPVSPQKQRVEARKRLTEETKRTAKVLLNNVGLEVGGAEIPTKLFPGTASPNLPAAIQLVNRVLKKEMDIKNGNYSNLSLEQTQRAHELLSEVLKKLTKTFKARMKDGHEEKG